MSQNTYISEIQKFVGQEVTLKGWAYNFRSSGKIFFLQLRDGSGRVQIVYSAGSLTPEQWETLQSLRIESSVSIRGTVKAEPRAPSGFELDGTSVEIIGLAPDDYPIGKKEHGPEFLLDNRHLWLRSESQWAVLRIRHWVKLGLQEFFNGQGFVELDTPTFTPNSCEGTTDLFEVEYFDKKAYLTQNGQLYLEAMCMAFGRVYDLCPNFRAEKSKTRKHLTEFWSLNPEIAFINHEESLILQEKALKFVVEFVLQQAVLELKVLERDVSELQAFLQEPFKHYEYKEAISYLQEHGSQIKYGDDLGAEDEEILTRDSRAAVVVKNWPKAIKPFYVKGHSGDPSLVFNADVLAPRGFGEIIGGSQREDNLEILEKNLHEHNLPLDIFSWYLDLRKYGSAPHCGFGIGIERVTRWIAGIHHVRETTAFPRMINRITP
ncbi:MAG: asparagine--tRNA ligase [Candidatus Uhrbacteria bacterium]